MRKNNYTTVSFSDLERLIPDSFSESELELEMIITFKTSTMTNYGMHIS